jgi:hypothetical protein
MFKDYREDLICEGIHVMCGAKLQTFLFKSGREENMQLDMDVSRQC